MLGLLQPILFAPRHQSEAHRSTPDKSLDMTANRSDRMVRRKRLRIWKYFQRMVEAMGYHSLFEFKDVTHGLASVVTRYSLRCRSVAPHMSEQVEPAGPVNSGAFRITTLPPSDQRIASRYPETA